MRLNTIIAPFKAFALVFVVALAVMTPTMRAYANFCNSEPDCVTGQFYCLYSQCSSCEQEPCCREWVTGRNRDCDPGTSWNIRECCLSGCQ